MPSCSSPPSWRPCAAAVARAGSHLLRGRVERHQRASSISVEDFFRPFNEHWLARHDRGLPRRSSRSSGMHSYLPYHGAPRGPARDRGDPASTRSSGAARYRAVAVGIALDRARLRERVREPLLGQSRSASSGRRPSGSVRCCCSTTCRRSPGSGERLPRRGPADGRRHDLRLRPVHARAGRVRPAPRPTPPALDRAAAACRRSVWGTWYLALGRSGVDTYGNPFTPRAARGDRHASPSTDCRRPSGPRLGGAPRPDRAHCSWWAAAWIAYLAVTPTSDPAAEPIACLLAIVAVST